MLLYFKIIYHESKDSFSKYNKKGGSFFFRLFNDGSQTLLKGLAAFA